MVYGFDCQYVKEHFVAQCENNPQINNRNIRHRQPLFI